MKLLLTVLGLLLGIVYKNSSQCTEINLCDSETINEIKNAAHSGSFNYNQDDYRRIFKEDFKFPDNGVREFWLDSGLIVNISMEEIQHMDNVYFFQNVTISPKNIASEFQDFTAKGENGSLKFRAKQIYGKLCGEKFDEQQASMALGFLKNRDALIKEGCYRVKIVEFAKPDNLGLRRLLFQSGTYFQDCIRIRHWHPDNQDNDYGIFIKNEEAFSLNYGSEDLFCKFTVEQVKKDF